MRHLPNLFLGPLLCLERPRLPRQMPRSTLLHSCSSSPLQIPAIFQKTDDFKDLEGPGTIAGPITVISETPMAISFSVHGESTIASDGVEHQVSVAVLPLQAKSLLCFHPSYRPESLLAGKVLFFLKMIHSFFDAIIFYPSAKFKTVVNTGCSQGPSASSSMTAMFPRLQST